MLVLRNASAGIDLTQSVEAVNSPLRRVVGWLGVARIAPLAGKWLRPCSSIHTIGMRSAIDVIFLDRQLRVVALHPHVSPYRLWLGHRRAASALEMGPGFLESAMLAVGDHVTLTDTADATRTRDGATPDATQTDLC